MNTKTENEILLWKEVWERKGEIAKQQFELADLLAINGYDTAASKVATENWLAYVRAIRARLKILPPHAVCEIGCGAGAFLLPLSDRAVKVWGVDYAENLIRICRRVMPGGTFEVAQARAVPFPSNGFDAVISSGVFIYFPDLKYAELAVKEIVRLLKPHGRAAILDVNDAAKKGRCESIKRQKLGDAEYERLYKNHRHLFYDKAWFEKIAARCHLRCEIAAQALSGYANGEFRFNAFLEKI
jgi:ubiquinone/menaquinone biosynthesis C-methylase UbiE